MNKLLTIALLLAATNAIRLRDDDDYDFYGDSSKKLEEDMSTVVSGFSGPTPSVAQ